MTPEQREQILEALRHGCEAGSDPVLEDILKEDLASLEPVIEEWIFQARDYYFQWAQHTCPATMRTELSCACGLLAAIAKRRRT
jgi:hypothetical protein